MSDEATAAGPFGEKIGTDGMHAGVHNFGGSVQPTKSNSPIEYQKVVDADNMEVGAHVCTLVDLNLFSGSSDIFRTQTGGFFYSVEDVSGNIDLSFMPFDREMGPTYPLAITPTTRLPYARNKYVNSVYSYPLRSTYSPLDQEYDRNKVIPNNKFVVSCDGDPGVIPNDKFWKILWLGGTFDEKEYSPIFKNNAVYDEYYSNYCHPYLISEKNALKNPAAISNYAQITTNYNLYIPEYQQRGINTDEVLMSDVNVNTWAYLYASGNVNAQFPTNMYNCLTVDDQITTSWMMFHSMSAYLVTSSNLSYAPDTEEWKRKKYKNVMFPDRYFSSGQDRSVETSASSYPYMMRINFPTERSNSIASYIADSGDSPRWLTLLKDIFVDNTSNLTLENKQFAKNRAFITSSGETNTKRSVNETVDLPCVDLIETLLYSRAKIKSLTDDYIFASGYGMEENAAYDTKALYRHLNSSNAVETLNSLVYGLKTEGGVRELYSLMNLKNNTEYVAYSGYEQQDIVPASMEAYLEKPEKKYTEVLAYRIDKIAGIAGQEVIQRYWFFNSPNTAKIDLFDSQIKYDKEYTYQVYEYRVIRGLKYQYSNFQLSRIIGAPTSRQHLDTSPMVTDWGSTLSEGYSSAFDHIDESDPDYQPPYYCMEYYDPYSSDEQTTGDLLDPTNYAGWGGSLQYVDPDTGMALAWTAAGSWTPYGGQMGTLATDAQRIARSRSETIDGNRKPYYANFLVTIEPRLTIFEIPMFSKTLKVQDSPPQKVHVQPSYIMDNTNTLKFEVFYEGFAHRTYPNSLEQSDVERRDSYLHAKDLFDDSTVDRPSISSHSTVQIYRIDFKPTKFTDFEGALHMEKSLRMNLPQTSKEYYYLSTCMYDRIPSNKKFYYAFRVVNENGIPGHITEILQAEYVNDGGYKYALFDTLFEEEIKKEEFNKTSKSIKKLVQLKPALEQILLNYDDADFSSMAPNELESGKISPGIAENLLWNKTFKFRLTSKKTGKKIDLNVTYKPKSNN